MSPQTPWIFSLLQDAEVKKNPRIQGRHGTGNGQGRCPSLCPACPDGCAWVWLINVSTGGCLSCLRAFCCAGCKPGLLGKAFLESQNYLSPTITPALPPNHVPKHHSHKILRPHHSPGQPVPVFDKEIFTTIHSKPPLLELEADCPVATWEKRQIPTCFQPPLRH